MGFKKSTVLSLEIMYTSFEMENSENANRFWV